MVDPVVEGTRLAKVLMDGGTSLNILYAETLEGMGILMSRLSTSNMSFYGVVPGKKGASLGQIALDVVFGDSKHFRKEKLTFEVVDFQSAYHAILGRSAYACFMARPCYVYLKLKMPGPKGVITISGNRRRQKSASRRARRSPMLGWWQKSGRNTKGTQTRVICCEPRSLLRNQRSSRPVRQNPFTSTRPT